MTPARPSLTAELLLLGIDPAKGGFLPCCGRRFRKALALASLADRGGGRHWPWLARRARREGLGELAREGILEPRRWFKAPRVADRTVAVRRF
ncbi:MAG: hypothetical protein LC790_22025, partial [Actinobacteria bacterium]|nr:hypothetical protein [Actinomycetota bacterium]